jgi:hypothetical protein
VRIHSLYKFFSFLPSSERSILQAEAELGSFMIKQTGRVVHRPQLDRNLPLVELTPDISVLSSEEAILFVNCTELWSEEEFK